MSFPLIFCTASILLLNPSNPAAETIPEVPTRAEANAVIAAAQEAKRATEVDRKASIQSIPARAEWRSTHHQRNVLYRHVDAPSARSSRRPETPSPLPAQPRPGEPPTTPLQEQPIIRPLNLVATVYDREITEILWRNHHGEVWRVFSNIDFNYLSGISGFVDEEFTWSCFIHVINIDLSIPQKQEMQQIAGFKRDLDLIADAARALPTTTPNYLILGERAEAAPPALREEMDALHHFFQAKEKRLIAEYERSQMLNEASRAWHAANPARPKDTVINFWKIR